MSLKIYIRQIPPTGERWEGQDEAALVGFPEFGVFPLGPLTYSLEGGLSMGGFFATGNLRLDVRLQCVACLDFFEYRIHIEDFAIQIDLNGKESVDLTPLVREDILLALPSYPRCDSISEQSCSAKFPSEALSVERELLRPPIVWEALRNLNLKQNIK